MFLDGFEFVPDGRNEDFTAWFGTDSDHKKFLSQFAQEGTGGLFCFWNEHGGDDFSASPIAYLGSEGEVGLAARNFDEFLSILSTGFILYSLVLQNEKFHFSAGESDEDLKGENEADFKKFVAWLEAECGVHPAADVDKLRAEIGPAEVVFKSWIDARRGR